MQMNCTNEPVRGTLPTLEEVMQKKFSELSVLEKMVLAGMTPTAEQMMLPDGELLEEVRAELAGEKEDIRSKAAQNHSVSAQATASKEKLLQKKFSDLTPEEKALLLN
jgi:hypothetical protein